MQLVTIYNLSQSDVLPVTVKYCASFLCRLRGLTFRRHLGSNQGLLLVQNHDSRIDSAIHMLGVWIDLAVVWINSAEEVVDVKLARRWHLIYVPKRPAQYVLEMAGECLPFYKVGDRVKIERI